MGNLFAIFKSKLNQLMDNSDRFITRANVLATLIVPAFVDTFNRSHIVRACFRKTGMSLHADAS